MRYQASEKQEIIRLVEQSHLPITQTLQKLGVSKPTFYRWYKKWLDHGLEGLEDKPSTPSRIWNRIPDNIRDRIIETALDDTHLSPRELAVKFTDTQRYFVSEASVYRILKEQDLITSPAYIVIKANDEYKDKTVRPNEMWQTDFTYLKVIGYGWFYLSTILDDYSRYIIAWKLCSTMRVEDVTDTVQLAINASGCLNPKVKQPPRLLSDNGPAYIAHDLEKWLKKKGITQIHGAPMHPQTQGKIERWHQTLKNRILLENYFFPEDLESQIETFVNYYNNHRYHESLNNVTPAVVYLGRANTIIEQRRKIKTKTLEKRRLIYQKNAA